MTEIEGCFSAENDMPVENSLPGHVSSANVSLVQIDLECNLSNFTREALVQRFGIEKIFPFAPVHDCRKHPVLAIYEEFTDNANPEQRLDDCPEEPVNPPELQAENQGNQ